MNYMNLFDPDRSNIVQAILSTQPVTKRSTARYEKKTSEELWVCLTEAVGFAPSITNLTDFEEVKGN